MLLLLRFGELALKSKRVRSRLTTLLVRNIEDALRSEGIQNYRLQREWSRIFVETPDPRAPEILRRVFGLSSLSVVEALSFRDLEDIVRFGAERFIPQVRGRRFAVRAQRSGTHPFRSVDIERKLGAALAPYGKVDLTHPEITVQVEVRDGRAYFFTEKHRGPGGLPLGSQGKAVALISGGFDSAVAAWFTLKRGVALDYVFCSLGGCAHEEGVLKVAKVLADRWSYGTYPRIHMVDFSGLLMEMRRKVKQSYWNVILKRLMYRTALRIAEETGALGIVTGEAIGQVSSQTLHNLYAVSRGFDIPFLRPLLGFDKEEIIEAAKRIGTYDLSAIVQEYCAVVPAHPVTHATPEGVARQEARLDPSLLERALQNRRVLDLRALKPEEILVSTDLEVEGVPEGAVVVDLRNRSKYEAAHYPGALHLSPEEALAHPERFAQDRTYVFYCDYGLTSLAVAEALRRHGIKAMSLKGGWEALRQALPAHSESPEKW